MALFDQLGEIPGPSDYIQVVRRLEDTDSEHAFAAYLSEIAALIGDSFPDGSLAAPAISFAKQPDQGIYRPFTDRTSIVTSRKHVASFSLRDLNDDDNTWLLLGTGEDITNTVNDTYTATLGVQTCDIYDNSRFFGINIGNASIRAQDQVTKTGISAMMELDKLEVYADAGAVQFDVLACARVRLPIPKTDVTAGDIYGLTFSLPNSSDVTGTASNWAHVYVPLPSSPPSGNIYGILFGYTPTTGASIGSKDGKDINVTAGQGGSNSNVNIDVTLNTSRVRLRNATKDIVEIGSSSGSNWTKIDANSTPTIAAQGSGSNVGLILLGKGTSPVQVGSPFEAGTNATDRVRIQGLYRNPANAVVAVPTIATGEVDEVAVDVSGAFAIQPALGDAVIAIPMEALPTDCILLGAWVSATDTITVSFGAKEGGGGVTGANRNFRFFVLDLT